MAAANVIMFYYFSVYLHTNQHEGFHLENTDKQNHNKLLVVAVVNKFPPPPLGKVSNFARCLFITRLRYFNFSIAPIIISIIISELINVTNLNRSFSHQGLKRSLADHGICKSNK